MHPVNSFQSHLKKMNTLHLMKLSELTTVALGGNKMRMLYSPSTVKAD